eukprot:SAG11_NODE_30092_length_304_cov_0.760976_1_plen_59_part_01
MGQGGALASVFDISLTMAATAFARSGGSTEAYCACQLCFRHAIATLSRSPVVLIDSCSG